MSTSSETQTEAGEAPNSASRKQRKSLPPVRQYGQSGPPIELPLDRMNDAERRITEIGRYAESVSIADMATQCFPGLSKVAASLAVRNALRRLVRGGWLAKAERGRYKMTVYGQSQLSVLPAPT